MNHASASTRTPSTKLRRRTSACRFRKLPNDHAGVGLHAGSVHALRREQAAREQVTDEAYADRCRADGVSESITKMSITKILTTMYHAVDHGEFERVTDHIDIERRTSPQLQTVPAYLNAVLQ